MIQRFADCSRENQRSDLGRYSRLRLAQAGVGLGAENGKAASGGKPDRALLEKAP
jgi:hypothetical protein